MQQEHGLNENDGTSLKRNEKKWSEREGGRGGGKEFVCSRY